MEANTTRMVTLNDSNYNIGKAKMALIRYCSGNNKMDYQPYNTEAP